MTIAEKLTKIAENEQKVYDAGYVRGYDDGEIVGGGSYDEGFEAGKQAEYDAFWDAYQQNGNRTDYAKGFCGRGWNDETFKPKYTIKVVGSANDFIPSTEVTDIAASLKACGVEMDLSECTSLSWGMSDLKTTTTLPILNVPKVTNFGSCFYRNSKLHTIEKIILNNQGNQPFSNTFNYLTALENITFEGVIGQDINFQWSTKLTKASITNIIEHLSLNASGKTLTLSKTAADTAFPCWYENENGEWVNVGCGANGEWLELIAPKVENGKWIIDLV